MLDHAWVDELRDELDEIGQALGNVRDLDVLVAHLTEESADLQADAASELIAPLERDRDEARAKLRAALKGSRYFELLDRLDAAGKRLPVTRTDLSVEDLARKEFGKLLRFRKQATLEDDAQLHELRIQGKRARYAAELAAASRGSGAKGFIKESTNLQDLLGEHQDAVVALAQLSCLLRLTDTPGAAFVAGRLVEREEHRKLRVRHELPPIWKRVKKLGKDAW
jgi:CHAD domain-containing protein